MTVPLFDGSTLDAPDYDPAAVLRLLGSRGHLALEVHDNEPGIRVEELDSVAQSG